jgi:hypothetical protein
MTGRGMNDRVSIPGRGKNFSLYHRVHIGSEAKQASYPVVPGGIKQPFSEVKHSPPWKCQG